MSNTKINAAIFALNAVGVMIFESVVKLIDGPALATALVPGRHASWVPLLATIGLFFVLFALVVVGNHINALRDRDQPDDSFMIILALPFIFGAMIGFWFLI